LLPPQEVLCSIESVSQSVSQSVSHFTNQYWHISSEAKELFLKEKYEVRKIKTKFMSDQLF